MNEHLDADTAGMVCEFLINGDDYAPFTLADIRRLGPRIHNWPGCMVWAARAGNVAALKHAGKQKGVGGVAWERCAEAAAAHGSLAGFKYAASRAFWHGWAAWQIGMICAVKKGHAALARYASRHFSVRSWREALLEAAAAGDLELVKHFAAPPRRHRPPLHSPATWKEFFWRARQNRHAAVMAYAKQKSA